jgi:hypothetical protein
MLFSTSSFATEQRSTMTWPDWIWWTWCACVSWVEHKAAHDERRTVLDSMALIVALNAILLVVGHKKFPSPPLLAG